jgi:hypothetical protein
MYTVVNTPRARVKKSAWSSRLISGVQPTSFSRSVRATKKLATLSQISSPSAYGPVATRDAVDRLLVGVHPLAQFLADAGDLLRALAKQAAVERFYLLCETLDQLAVVGELRAKLCVFPAQMRHQQARSRIERCLEVVDIFARHRQP